MLEATVLTGVFAGLCDPRTVVAACGAMLARYRLRQFGGRTLPRVEDRAQVEGLAARRGREALAHSDAGSILSVAQVDAGCQGCAPGRRDVMALPADTFVEIDTAMRRFGTEGGADRALRYLLRELQAVSIDRTVTVPLTEQEHALLDAEGFTAGHDAERPSDAVDPLLRGATHRAALISTALPPEDVALGLGRSVTRIYHMLREKQLYGVRDGRLWRLPRFQFVSEGERLAIVPGVPTLFPHLPRDLSVAAIANWFTVVAQPQLVSETGKPLPPRAWLLAGGAPQRVTLPALLFM